MGASEAACVAYVALVAAALLTLLARRSRRGELCWHTLSWSHVTHDARGLGPRALGAIRLTMGAYALGTLVAIVWDKPHVLSTFTMWCWMLIGLYLSAAGVASLLEAAKGTSQEDSIDIARTTGRRKIVSCIMWVWFEAMFSTAILVFLVVWLVLLPWAYMTTGSDAHMLSFLTLSAHNLNVVFMGTEMMLNRLAFVPDHAIFVMLYGICYVVFSWFYFLFGSRHRFWYFFLDWRRTGTPIWYTLLLLIIWAAFAGGQRLATRAKARLASELPGRAREASAWPAAETQVASASPA